MDTDQDPDNAEFRDQISECRIDDSEKASADHSDASDAACQVFVVNALGLTSDRVLGF